MEINTVFNIGDKVYYLGEKQIVSSVVSELDIKVFETDRGNSVQILVFLENGKFIEEFDLYLTKEALVENLLDN